LPPDDPVRSYFTCLDNEDWDAMRELWHADAELRAVGTRPRNGVDEVIAYFSTLFSPWPQHTDAPTRLLTAGQTVVAEVKFTGTMADGREVSFDAVDVIDLEDGRIRRLTNWYDIAYARRVLSESENTAP
jgi:ketosteroid isomerase-like protein